MKILDKPLKRLLKIQDGKSRKRKRLIVFEKKKNIFPKNREMKIFPKVK